MHAGARGTHLPREWTVCRHRRESLSSLQEKDRDEVSVPVAAFTYEYVLNFYDCCKVSMGRLLNADNSKNVDV